MIAFMIPLAEDIKLYSKNLVMSLNNISSDNIFLHEKNFLVFEYLSVISNGSYIRISRSLRIFYFKKIEILN